LPGWTPPPRPARAPLEGRLCRLAPLSAAAHADDLHAAGHGDDAAFDYLPYGPFPDAAAHRAWVEGVEAGADPLFFAVVPHATGRAAGVAAFLRIAPEHGAIEVGHIRFTPVLRGATAATEAMALMMACAFGLGYRRYEWKCNALNLPSRRLAQRLGLSFEGVFRHHMVVKGRSRDSAWYAATDADWPALAATFDRWLDPANFDAEGRQRMRLSEMTAPLLAARG
jgi:RimJ/RimL family protein N-acetyltransferase